MGDLERLVQATIGVGVESAQFLGEGAYGILWDVTLAEGQGRVVVKWQKRPGRGALEKRQLEELGKHALVAVPKVLGYHAPVEDLPFEALVMERIPGVPASTLPVPDRIVRDRLADQIVDILVCWHSVRNPLGYGDIGGPYYPRWLDFFGTRLGAYLEHLRGPTCRDLVSPAVRGMAEESFSLAEDIIGPVASDAVLIHSDFWLPNIMVEPDDYTVTGVIDPLDAEWAHRELDLILLEHSWGKELGLLERYMARCPLDDGYRLRLAFYQFWYAMQNLARIGWYEEEEGLKLASALKDAIRDYV